MKQHSDFNGRRVEPHPRAGTVALLIMPGFPMGCLSSAVEAMRAANQISGHEHYRWQIISETGAPVTCSAGIAFAAHAPLDALERVDTLYVISSPQAEMADAKRTLGALRRLERMGVTMGAFSGGVFPLAQAGLLDGYRVSVHWCYEAAFRAAFPRAIPGDAVMTIDRRRETASGANAVFDLMLRRIGAELDTQIMTEVACWFQHPMVRSESVSQRRPSATGDSASDMLPAPVTRAIAVFRENIDTPVPIGDVAREAAVSVRHLERIFKQATGLGPLAYYRQMRLDEARQMVRFSNTALRDVAFAVGYSTVAGMSRHYRAAFGVTPHEDRDDVDLFRVRTRTPA